MAEMLVDSTKLDACLDAEADAIRAKTGGSSDIPFDFANNKGFADAIAAIPSGGKELDATAAGFNVSGGTLTKQNVVFDFGEADINLQDFLRNAKTTFNNTTVEIRCGKITSLYRAFTNTVSPSDIESVILTCKPFTSSISVTEMNRNGRSIRRILGTPLYVTTFSSGAYRSFNNNSLKEVYFVPNVMTASGVFSSSVLEDSSVVSIANALKSGLETTQTLTIDNATTKAKFSTILGSVSQVTGASGTYDFFTADENGTVTLLDFITNTKGWTVA